MVLLSIQQVYNDLHEKWQCHRRLKHKGDFLKKLSVLLQEGYTFYESIHMLAPYHIVDEEEGLAFVAQHLNEGHTMTRTLAYFGIPARHLMMLQLAEQRGQFERALETVAQHMMQQQKNKQTMFKLLAYPVTLFVLLICLLIGFRQFFLPQMSAMFYTTTTTSTIELTISTILLHLPDILLATLFIVISAIIITISIVLQRQVSSQMQLIYKIYPIRRLVQLMLTKQLAASLGTLLASGLSLQDALTMLTKQTYQRYIQYVAQQLRMRVSSGFLLSAAIQQLPYFQHDFYSCALHGEQGGNLGRELMMYSELLAEKEQTFMNRALQVIQPIFFSFIAICILGAYLAILLPMYDMLDHV